MSIPTASKPSPIPALTGNVPLIDVKTGLPTQEFLLAYERLRMQISGGNRIIPCSASMTSNLITLTPNDDSPLLEGYRDYDIFIFAADATSDGEVTATVSPKTGSLATLKVYDSDGASQTTTGGIVSDSVYALIFADHLDSAAGGFVKK